MVYGVVVLASYLVFDTFNARISEYGIGTFLQELLDVETLGHACVHGILTALAYLAIEPYVRRVWPRALIGWARLTQLRLRDPAVAREALIGAASALGIGAVLYNGLIALWVVLGRTIPLAPYDRPALMGNAAQMLTEVPHQLAVAMYFSIQLYFLLLLVRLLVRRDWATMLVAVLVPGAVTAAFLVAAPRVGPAETFFAVLALGLVFGWFAMIVRVGLVATLAYGFVFFFFPTIPFTLDLSAFYAPQAIFGIAVYAALVIPGFCHSWPGLPKRESAP